MKSPNETQDQRPRDLKSSRRKESVAAKHSKHTYRAISRLRWHITNYRTSAGRISLMLVSTFPLSTFRLLIHCSYLNIVLSKPLFTSWYISFGYGNPRTWLVSTPCFL